MAIKTLEVGIDPTKGFTPTQRERYYVLSCIYGEAAATIIPYIKGRGQNSYASVYEKAVKVNKAKPSLKDYYASLSEEILTYKKVTDDAIIRAVTEARAEHDMPPFLKRIKTQCLQEFYNLFIFEEVVDETDDEIESELREYKILCKLLAK
ncbi:hypothetical protein [Pedobacter heparinus]|uniref:hypothetical protein n=1 Tax=Pedobacter heparinus TaxID=984 RepID=UPI00292F1FC3|nr:hypothetical protein [Pedobacter heparinus]